MKITQITWETFRPLEFRCMVCNKNEATLIVHQDNWQIPVCQFCAQLSWDEIINKIFPKKER